MPVLEIWSCWIPRHPFATGQRTTMLFCGTARIFVPGGCVPPYGRRSCFFVSAGPATSECLTVVVGLMTILPLTFFAGVTVVVVLKR